MRRHRPVVVVGLGGFVTGPGGVAAWLLRRPLVIHEQNAVAGFTNRCLAHLARRVLEAFPGQLRPRGARARDRQPGARATSSALPPPARALRRPRRGRCGCWCSAAARVPRGSMRSCRSRWRGWRRRLGFDVRHQAGERWLEAGRASYAQAGVRADVRPFIEDMAEAYGWADLVICRAGALTVSELAAAGVGAVLVPFPARGRRSPDPQRRSIWCVPARRS